MEKSLKICFDTTKIIIYIKNFKFTQTLNYTAGSRECRSPAGEGEAIYLSTQYKNIKSLDSYIKDD